MIKQSHNQHPNANGEDGDASVPESPVEKYQTMNSAFSKFDRPQRLENAEWVQEIADAYIQDARKTTKSLIDYLDYVHNKDLQEKAIKALVDGKKPDYRAIADMRVAYYEDLVDVEELTLLDRVKLLEKIFEDSRVSAENKKRLVLHVFFKRTENGKVVNNLTAVQRVQLYTQALKFQDKVLNSPSGHKYGRVLPKKFVHFKNLAQHAMKTPETYDLFYDGEGMNRYTPRHQDPRTLAKRTAMKQYNRDFGVVVDDLQRKVKLRQARIVEEIATHFQKQGRLRYYLDNGIHGFTKNFLAKNGPVIRYLPKWVIVYEIESHSMFTTKTYEFKGKHITASQIIDLFESMERNQGQWFFKQLGIGNVPQWHPYGIAEFPAVVNELASLNMWDYMGQRGSIHEDDDDPRKYPLSIDPRLSDPESWDPEEVVLDKKPPEKSLVQVAQETDYLYKRKTGESITQTIEKFAKYADPDSWEEFQRKRKEKRGKADFPRVFKRKERKTQKASEKVQQAYDKRIDGERPEQTGERDLETLHENMGPGELPSPQEFAQLFADDPEPDRQARIEPAENAMKAIEKGKKRANYKAQDYDRISKELIAFARKTKQALPTHEEMYQQACGNGPEKENHYQEEVLGEWRESIAQKRKENFGKGMYKHSLPVLIQVFRALGVKFKIFPVDVYQQLQPESEITPEEYAKFLSWEFTPKLLAEALDQAAEDVEEFARYRDAVAELERVEVEQKNFEARQKKIDAMKRALASQQDRKNREKYLERIRLDFEHMKENYARIRKQLKLVVAGHKVAVHENRRRIREAKVKYDYAQYLNEDFQDAFIENAYAPVRLLSKALDLTRQLKPGDIRIGGLFLGNYNEIKLLLPDFVRKLAKAAFHYYTFKTMSLRMDLKFVDAWREFGKTSFLHSKLGSKKAVFALDFPHCDPSGIETSWYQAANNKGGTEEWMVRTLDPGSKYYEEIKQRSEQRITTKQFVNHPVIRTYLNFRLPEQELVPKIARFEASKLIPTEYKISLEDCSDVPVDEAYLECRKRNCALFLTNPTAEREPKFTESRWQISRARLSSRHRDLYFSHFPTADPSTFQRDCTWLAHKMWSARWWPFSTHQSLYDFFNQKSVRRRFNLPEGREFKAIIYDKVSMKRIGSLDCSKANPKGHSIATLWRYVDSDYVVHVKDPMFYKLPYAVDVEYRTWNSKFCNVFKGKKDTCVKTPAHVKSAINPKSKANKNREHNGFSQLVTDPGVFDDSSYSSLLSKQHVASIKSLVKDLTFGQSPKQVQSRKYLYDTLNEIVTLRKQQRATLPYSGFLVKLVDLCKDLRLREISQNVFGFYLGTKGTAPKPSLGYQKVKLSSKYTRAQVEGKHQSAFRRNVERWASRFTVFLQSTIEEAIRAILNEDVADIFDNNDKDLKDLLAQCNLSCVVGDVRTAKIFGRRPFSHVFGRVESPKQLSFFDEKSVLQLYRTGKYPVVNPSSLNLTEEVFSKAFVTVKNDLESASGKPKPQFPSLNGALSKALSGLSPNDLVRDSLYEASKHGSTWGFALLCTGKETSKFDPDGRNFPRTTFYYDGTSPNSFNEKVKWNGNVTSFPSRSGEPTKPVKVTTLCQPTSVSSRRAFSFKEFAEGAIVAIRDLAVKKSAVPKSVRNLYFAKVFLKQLKGLINVACNAIYSAVPTFDGDPYLQYRHFSSIAHVFSELSRMSNQLVESLRVCANNEKKIAKIVNKDSQFVQCAWEIFGVDVSKKTYSRFPWFDPLLTTLRSVKNATNRADPNKKVPTAVNRSATFQHVSFFLESVVSFTKKMFAKFRKGSYDQVLAGSANLRPQFARAFNLVLGAKGGSSSPLFEDGRKDVSRTCLKSVVNFLASPQTVLSWLKKLFGSFQALAWSSSGARTFSALGTHDSFKQHVPNEKKVGPSLLQSHYSELYKDLVQLLSFCFKYYPQVKAMKLSSPSRPRVDKNRIFANRVSKLLRREKAVATLVGELSNNPQKSFLDETKLNAWYALTCKPFEQTYRRYLTEWLNKNNVGFSPRDDLGTLEGKVQKAFSSTKGQSLEPPEGWRGTKPLVREENLSREIPAPSSGSVKLKRDVFTNYEMLNYLSTHHCAFKKVGRSLVYEGPLESIEEDARKYFAESFHELGVLKDNYANATKKFELVKDFLSRKVQSTTKKSGGGTGGGKISYLETIQGGLDSSGVPRNSNKQMYKEIRKVEETVKDLKKTDKSLAPLVEKEYGEKATPFLVYAKKIAIEGVNTLPTFESTTLRRKVSNNSTRRNPNFLYQYAVAHYKVENAKSEPSLQQVFLVLALPRNHPYKKGSIPKLADRHVALCTKLLPDGGIKKKRKYPLFSALEEYFSFVINEKKKFKQRLTSARKSGASGHFTVHRVIDIASNRDPVEYVKRAFKRFFERTQKMVKNHYGYDLRAFLETTGDELKNTGVFSKLDATTSKFRKTFTKTRHGNEVFKTFAQVLEANTGWNTSSGNMREEHVAALEKLDYFKDFPLPHSLPSVKERRENLSHLHSLLALHYYLRYKIDVSSILNGKGTPKVPNLALSSAKPFASAKSSQDVQNLKRVAFALSNLFFLSTDQEKAIEDYRFFFTFPLDSFAIRLKPNGDLMVDVPWKVIEPKVLPRARPTKTLGIDLGLRDLYTARGVGSQVCARESKDYEKGVATRGRERKKTAARLTSRVERSQFSRSALRDRAVLAAVQRKRKLDLRTFVHRSTTRIVREIDQDLSRGSSPGTAAVFVEDLKGYQSQSNWFMSGEKAEWPRGVSERLLEKSAGHKVVVNSAPAAFTTKACHKCGKEAVKGFAIVLRDCKGFKKNPRGEFFDVLLGTSKFLDEKALLRTNARHRTYFEEKLNKYAIRQIFAEPTMVDKVQFVPSAAGNLLRCNHEDNFAPVPKSTYEFIDRDDNAALNLRDYNKVEFTITRLDIWLDRLESGRYVRKARKKAKKEWNKLRTMAFKAVDFVNAWRYGSSSASGFNFVKRKKAFATQRSITSKKSPSSPLNDFLLSRSALSGSKHFKDFWEFDRRQGPKAMRFSYKRLARVLFKALSQVIYPTFFERHKVAEKVFEKRIMHVAWTRSGGKKPLGSVFSFDRVWFALNAFKLALFQDLFKVDAPYVKYKDFVSNAKSSSGLATGYTVCQATYKQLKKSEVLIEVHDKYRFAKRGSSQKNRWLSLRVDPREVGFHRFFDEKNAQNDVVEKIEREYFDAYSLFSHFAKVVLERGDTRRFKAEFKQATGKKVPAFLFKYLERKIVKVSCVRKKDSRYEYVCPSCRIVHVAKFIGLVVPKYDEISRRDDRPVRCGLDVLFLHIDKNTKDFRAWLKSLQVSKKTGKKSKKKQVVVKKIRKGKKPTLKKRFKPIKSVSRVGENKALQIQAVMQDLEASGELKSITSKEVIKRLDDIPYVSKEKAKEIYAKLAELELAPKKDDCT